MSVKSAITKVMIEGILQEVFIRTNVENVLVGEGESQVTLAAKLSEIITSLNEKAKKSDVTAEISQAIDGLIGGAPATYDTLKEIADYISTHEDIVVAINAAIGNKVDKVEGKGLSANDFTDELKAKVASMGAMAAKDKVSESDLDATLAEKMAAAQANTIEGVKVNGEDITPDEDKKVNILVPKIYVQTTEPAQMKNGDLLLQIVE